MRTCSKCSILKDESEFYIRKKPILRVITPCKTCIKMERALKYYNSEKYRFKVLDYAKNYNIKNRNKLKLHAKEYNKQPLVKARINAYVNERYHNDPEFRARVNFYHSRRFKERYHNDPEFRAKHLNRKKLKRKT